jgi:integrase
MARTLGKLSAVAVEKQTKPGRHSDGGGLYLNVSSTGSKSWLFMWVKGGRRREMGLGPYPAVSLKAAREKAVDCRRLIAEGRDPISERDKQVGKTFGECADLYIASMQRNWRNEKHRKQWQMTLTVYCEKIRDRPISMISTEDVLSVLTPIWNTKNETASRLRGRMELVLDFATTKGWRAGDNPARWRGHLKSILPARTKLSRGHHAAMNYQEVPAFMERLSELQAMAARALEFTILNAARTSEVLNATWDEIDLDNGLWTIPAHRMKAAEEHVIPLSKAALGILRPLSEAQLSQYVFPGQKSGKPLSSMAMEMLLRRMKVRNATVHGFRSSFRDWCGDETSFPREVAEAALAHKVGSEVERAYRRGKAIEKRRQLMEVWASYCCETKEKNVVPLVAREAQK